MPIVLRLTKGSELSYEEGDANLLGLANGSLWDLVALAAKQISFLEVGGNHFLFPATQVPSANPNALDDYEEGVFTPVISGNFGHSPAAYFTQKGRYTKVGNRVDWGVEVQINGYGTLTDTEALRITGLPFTPGTGANYPGEICGFLRGSSGVPLSLTTWPHVVLEDGDPTIYLKKNVSEGSLIKTDIASNQQLFASGTFWV